MRFRSASLVAVLAAASFTVSGAQARELVYGSWVSPKHGLNEDALPVLFNGVRKDTNGAIDWKLVAGGQLAKSHTTLAAIKDGLIDGGFVISVFVPQDLPSVALLHSTVVPGDDSVAAAAAMNETVLLDCPSCIAEFKKNGAVYLAGYATTPYYFMCRDKITSAEDFKGKKVRATAGGVALTKLAGGVPVAMSPAAATTALQRGTIDCVLGAIAWLKSYGYQDVAKYMVHTPMGLTGPAVGMSMSRKVWLSMTDAQRAAHMKYLPLAAANMVISAYMNRDKAILAHAKEVGVQWTDGGPIFQKAMDTWVAEQDAKNIQRFVKLGAKDSAKILAAYHRNLKKWQALSPAIGTDLNKYAAALKREIFDKVDISKF